MSKKIGKATNIRFGFVIFKSEMEVERAMKRNNGLDVKGHLFKISKEKYDKRRYEVERSPQTKTSTNKVWIPSYRDGRSYKEVVDKVPIIPSKGSKDLKAWLNNSLVCVSKYTISIPEALELIKTKDLKDTFTSRVKSFSFIVHTKSKEGYLKFEEEEIEKLRSVFHEVRPWSDEFKTRFKYDYLITSIPLQLWTKETITKIGNSIGAMKEIEY